MILLGALSSFLMCSNTLGSGIYLIKNEVNGKGYVGSAVNFEKRLYEHRRTLTHGNHRGPHLQAAWNEYGPSAFVVYVLEYCDPIDGALLTAETKWIVELKSADNRFGYNMCPVSGTRRGAKMPASAVAKVAEMKKGNTYRLGKVHSEETRQKIRESLTGGKISEETRAKLSAIRKGKKKSPEHKAKIAAGNRGKKRSDAMREQTSLTMVKVWAEGRSPRAARRLEASK